MALDSVLLKYSCAYLNVWVGNRTTETCFNACCLGMWCNICRLRAHL